MASTYIYRTLGTPTNSKKYTYSLWIKKANPDTVQLLLSAGTSSSDGDFLVFRAGDYLEWQMYHSGDVGILKTKRLFRDPAAWMHIVIAYDSTDGTAGDRMKMYINGVRETEWLSTPVDPTLNLVSRINSAVQHNIGHDTYGLVSGDYFDGEMSHVQFVDGLALAPTEFGSVDATSGIWKIKTGCYATPGNNGFCLKMEDRTNLDLDSSSNAHTFTTSGTLTATEDNPSNNFCTFNSIVGNRSGFTYSNGNTKIVTPGSSGIGSTMGFNSGKWYYEHYINTLGNHYVGWQDISNLNADENVYIPYGGICLNIEPAIYYNHGSSLAYKGVPSFTTGDYIGAAFDMDNLKLWFSKNGQWYSADSTTASTLTRAEVSAGDNAWDCTTGSTMSAASTVAPWQGCSTASTTNSFNFGNGSFGSTALTGTTYADDAGIGTFKYEPPDGFRAICTKNIKAYGG